MGLKAVERMGAISVIGRARHKTSFTAKDAKGREGTFALNISTFLLGLPSSLSDLELCLHKLRADKLLVCGNSAANGKLEREFTLQSPITLPFFPFFFQPTACGWFPKN